MAKKKPVLHQWAVPMKFTYRGTLYVEAATEEEAAEKAEAWDTKQEQANEELTDWDVVGEPKIDE